MVAASPAGRVSRSRGTVCSSSAGVARLDVAWSDYFGLRSVRLAQQSQTSALIAKHDDDEH